MRTEETRNQNLVKLRIFQNKDFTSNDRKAAASLKDNDILENFRNDVLKQLPEDYKDKLPDVPQKGDLDINELRKSEFFFA